MLPITRVRRPTFGVNASILEPAAAPSSNRMPVPGRAPHEHAATAALNPDRQPRRHAPAPARHAALCGRHLRSTVAWWIARRRIMVMPARPAADSLLYCVVTKADHIAN